MSINQINEQRDLSPKITVIGIGGAGNNAVNNMIRSNLQGVEYLVCNTDAQHLTQSLVEPERRIHLGVQVTQGLGAGSKPEIGRAAAEESLDDIMRHIKGSHMIFITAGMGGGTGTGAAPVIAKAAREAGILTVGVITKPFSFEGPHRMRAADKGIKEITQCVDTLIVIPNQNLFRIANANTTLTEAFKMADHVLFSGVRSVTDLMIMPGLINLDFADIRNIMTEMGKAMMGTGEASGEGRANAAAEAAISNPLLDDVSMRGAKGVLINITGGLDITLCEVDEAATRIREEIDADNLNETNIIFGSTFDEKMEGTIRVSVVATGIDSHKLSLPQENIEEQKLGPALNVSNAVENFESNIFIHADSIPQQINPQENNIVPSFDSLNEKDSVKHIQLVESLSAIQSNETINPDQLHSTGVKDLKKQGTKTFERSIEIEPKKGFFTRFIDTIAGRNAEDETNGPSTDNKFKTQQSNKMSHKIQAEDETDMQDIPAYLRRKSK